MFICFCFWDSEMSHHFYRVLSSNVAVNSSGQLSFSSYVGWSNKCLPIFTDFVSLISLDHGSFRRKKKKTPHKNSKTPQQQNPNPNVTFALAVSKTFVCSSAMGIKKDFPVGEFN